MAFKNDVSKNKIILYVVTTGAVMSYDVTNNGNKLVIQVYDNITFQIISHNRVVFAYILLYQLTLECKCNLSTESERDYWV